MSSDGRRRRYLSYDERVLWSTVTEAIKPLKPAAPAAETIDSLALPVVPKVKAPPPPRPKASPAKPTLPAKPSLPKPSLLKPVTPPLAALGRRERSRVARGKQAIDARFDLHGLTQEEAHGALMRFLRSAVARDARLVLIITGKGDRGGGRGVLKRLVPQWLGLPEFRALVVGFEDAHIAHGGEGALYVRLRRER